MTQLEVGKKLDVSESYYSLIEKGERQEDMSISMARKLADVFGVPIEKILEMEGGVSLMQSASAAEPICKLDEEGKPILSERDKKLGAVQEEVVQVLKKHNLSVGDAINAIDLCKKSICLKASEMPF